MDPFNATFECKKYNRKVSHFLRNEYVKQYVAINNIPLPKLERRKATMLDNRLRELLEWWLNKGYKNGL
jgi:hypothetical protein